MKKSKKTKKALILSLGAIMLSITMLIGSTLAWFTDTATSGKNKIVAGNLDVELYHSNKKTERTQVTDSTQLFKVDLWEPGVVAYENFEVVNNGDLSLKYKFTMAIGGYNTVKDTDKSLKDVLRVAVLEEEDFNGTREDLADLDFTMTVSEFEKEGVLDTKSDNDKFAIVVYWEPSAIDNDYNLNNGKESSDSQALYIDLGINLVATQNSYEEDTFGSDYDAMVTEVADKESFLEAVKNAEAGYAIKITEDITLTEVIPQSLTGETIIDLNNHTLTSNTTSQMHIEDGQSVTIKNGNLALTSSKVDNPAITIASGGSITLDGVTLTSNTGAGLFPYGDAATVNVLNSTMTTHGLAIGTNASTADNYNVKINIKNSTINGSTASGSAGSAILINIPCEVNIEKSTVNGYFHGVIVRGGNVTIKNSTITNTTTDSNYDSLYHHFDKINWGSGNTVFISALTIGNKAPGAYQYPAKVTLINTKVEAKAAEGSTKTMPAVYMYGNSGDGLGATLTYDSKSTITGDVIQANEYTKINKVN